MSNQTKYFEVVFGVFRNHPNYFAVLQGSMVFHGPMSLLTISGKYVQSTEWFQTQLPHFANHFGVEKKHDEISFGQWENVYKNAGMLYLGWGPENYFHTPERVSEKKNVWKFKGHCGRFDHFFVGKKSDVLLEVSGNETFLPRLLSEKEEEDEEDKQ